MSVDLGFASLQTHASGLTGLRIQGGTLTTSSQDSKRCGGRVALNIHRILLNGGYAKRKSALEYCRACTSDHKCIDDVWNTVAY